MASFALVLSNWNNACLLAAVSSSSKVADYLSFFFKGAVLSHANEPMLTLTHIYFGVWKLMKTFRYHDDSELSKAVDTCWANNLKNQKPKQVKARQYKHSLYFHPWRQHFITKPLNHTQSIRVSGSVHVAHAVDTWPSTRMSATMLQDFSVCLFRHRGGNARVKVSEWNIPRYFAVGLLRLLSIKGFSFVTITSSIAGFPCYLFSL